MEPVSPLPVPPMARLMEREEGSETHSRIYTVVCLCDCVCVCGCGFSAKTYNSRSGLSRAAVTAGEDKPPPCLYTSNYPSPTGASQSSTHSAAECLPPFLHIILHYTVISSAVLSHLSRVCHDSTAPIYRFLSIAIEADQCDC